MDGGAGEEECGVNEEQGEFRNEVLAALIRRIYTCLVGIECWGATSVESSRE